MRVPQVGPPNERLDRFISQQTQKYKEEKAAEQARAAAEDKGKSPISVAPVQRESSSSSSNTPTGGIEAAIAKANSTANSAHSLAASVRSDFKSQIATVEQRFEAALTRISELESELSTLRDAARDAWMGTFWMYADIAQAAAIFDAPPPKGKVIDMAEAPATAMLFGEMRETRDGPAMQCRWAHPVSGQLRSGWMLLRDANGHKILENFRMHY